jgi:predicted nucleic acid-binding protein
VRLALDTNILVYAEGINGAERQAAALSVLRSLKDADIILPVQVLGELFHVLIRKGGRTAEAARETILTWREACVLIETSPAVLLRAMDLVVDHQLGTWDSVILAAAADAECQLLLSEDMQDGFIWGGVTVANPFAATPHPALQAL